MSTELFVQQLLNALSLGSIYALLALGMAVVFSVLRLLNFAYGELVTTTSYTIVFLLGLGVDFWVAALAGIASAVLLSLITEFIAIRPLRSAPPYAVIFSTFAVSLIVQALIRNFVSPRPQGLTIEPWMDGVIRLGSFRIPILSLITIAIAVTALIVLSGVLTKSKQGIAMQAAAEDFQTTRLMGAKAGALIRLAFIVSGVLAAIAGALWLARVGSATPDMGFTPLLVSFIAVVLGGMGSLKGAVLGGFALAFLEVTMQVFLPSEIVAYTQAFSLILIIIVLYFRPHGFAKKTEERVA